MASGDLWGYVPSAGSNNYPNYQRFEISWIENPEVRAAAIQAQRERALNTIDYSYITQNMAYERADFEIKEILRQLQDKAQNDLNILNVKLNDETPPAKKKTYRISSSMVAKLDAEVLREADLEANRVQFEELKNRRKVAAAVARRQAQAKLKNLISEINDLSNSIIENDKAGLDVEQAINALNAKKEQYEIQKINVALYSELGEIYFNRGFITSGVNDAAAAIAQNVYDFLEKLRVANQDSYRNKLMFLWARFRISQTLIDETKARDARNLEIAKELAKFEFFLAEARRNPQTFKERVLNYAKDLYKRFDAEYYDFESMTGEEIEEYSRQRTHLGTVTRVIYPGKTDKLGIALKPSAITKESQNLINYNGLGSTLTNEEGGQVNPNFKGWFGVAFASPKAIRIAYIGCLCASESGVQRDMPVALWRGAYQSSTLLASITINPGDTDVYYDGTYIFKRIPIITLNPSYTYYCAVYYRSVIDDSRQNDRYQYAIATDTENDGKLADGNIDYVKFETTERYTDDPNPNNVTWGATVLNDFSSFASNTLPAGNVGLRTEGFFTGKPRESFLYRQNRINYG